MYEIILIGTIVLQSIVECSNESHSSQYNGTLYESDALQMHFSMEWNSLSLKSATQSSLMGFTKRLLLLNGMQLYIGFTITWNGIHLY